MAGKVGTDDALVKRAPLAILRSVHQIESVMMSQKDYLNAPLFVGHGFNVECAQIGMVNTENVLGPARHWQRVGSLRLRGRKKCLGKNPQVRKGRFATGTRDHLVSLRIRCMATISAAHRLRAANDEKYEKEKQSARPLNTFGSADSLAIRSQFGDSRWHPDKCMVTRLMRTLGAVENAEWCVSVGAERAARHLPFREVSGQLLGDNDVVRRQAVLKVVARGGIPDFCLVDGAHPVSGFALAASDRDYEQPNNGPAPNPRVPMRSGGHSSATAESCASVARRQ